MFELNNEQRKYVGLDPILPHWDRVLLAGDKHRPESILYFDGDIIKRHIISTKEKYIEKQYEEATRNREMLLPKTRKGKEVPLQANHFEKRTPIGVSVELKNDNIYIASYTSETTFYNSHWDKPSDRKQTSIPQQIADFIAQSPANHLEEIAEFKQQKRKHVKFKKGDIFCFKLNRTQYGFGRVLLDVYKVEKENIIPKNHFWRFLFGRPVMIQFFVYASDTKNIPIEVLQQQKVLPCNVMMDNKLFYGEYEIIGNAPIPDEEYDFPINFENDGSMLYGAPKYILQWGLIQLGMSETAFDERAEKLKTLTDDLDYNNRGNGISPQLFRNCDLQEVLSGKALGWRKRDLRAPFNKKVKDEILTIFGLDPTVSYASNCKKIGLPLPSELKD
jgi:hypothetical protein